MIAKLTTGNGFFGAAKYELRVGEKAEPTDPKEVKILGLKGNINYTINERQEISVDIRQLARDFRFQAMMRPTVRKPVYHWALSWKKGEHISDTDMLERANEFMNAIGFENTQYIIIRHKKDNEHCHVLANIVDSCGNRISTEDLINRAHFAARMITKINGYAWGDNPTKETIENIHNPHEKIRYEIEPIVKEAVAKATCIEDVPDILKSHNISCEIKYSGEGKPVGISFAIEKDGQVHSFRGSSLDRKLSYKGIIRTIAKFAK